MSITPAAEAKRFMVDCLIAAGVSPEHSEILAKNLIEADYRGHYSHGMNRLQMYIRDVQGGFCNPRATPTIEKETVATALVNGNNGFGAVVGKYCMELAIEKAGNVGVGLVSVHSSNHYGIPGVYALQAINKHMIGMTFTNTSPLMVPPGAKEPVLGTNPLAIGAPGLDDDSFLLDMATTTVAVGKIELAKRKGISIPEGWALNEDGQTETNPTIAFNKPKLTPIGGYKGYGLGMLVEVLCGILSGSNYGPNIGKWGAPQQVSNLGHCFIAINPKMFADGFETRMSDLMNLIRRMTPAQPDKPVLVPGDPERIHMEKVNKEGGLRYTQDQLKINAELASELKVKPMVANCQCKVSDVK